jgi:hypothetical protein
VLEESIAPNFGVKRTGLAAGPHKLACCLPVSGRIIGSASGFPGDPPLLPRGPLQGAIWGRASQKGNPVTALDSLPVGKKAKENESLKADILSVNPLPAK